MHISLWPLAFIFMTFSVAVRGVLCTVSIGFAVAFLATVWYRYVSRPRSFAIPHVTLWCSIYQLDSMFFGARVRVLYRSFRTEICSGSTTCFSGNTAVQRRVREHALISSLLRFSSRRAYWLHYRPLDWCKLDQIFCEVGESPHGATGATVSRSQDAAIEQKATHAP